MLTTARVAEKAPPRIRVASTIIPNCLHDSDSNGDVRLADSEDNNEEQVLSINNNSGSDCLANDERRDVLTTSMTKVPQTFGHQQARYNKFDSIPRRRRLPKQNSIGALDVVARGGQNRARTTRSDTEEEDSADAAASNDVSNHGNKRMGRHSSSSTGAHINGTATALTSSSPNNEISINLNVSNSSLSGQRKRRRRRVQQQNNNKDKSVKRKSDLNKADVDDATRAYLQLLSYRREWARQANRLLGAGENSEPPVLQGHDYDLLKEYVLAGDFSKATRYAYALDTDHEDAVRISAASSLSNNSFGSSNATLTTTTNDASAFGRKMMDIALSGRTSPVSSSILTTSSLHSELHEHTIPTISSPTCSTPADDLLTPSGREAMLFELDCCQREIDVCARQLDEVIKQRRLSAANANVASAAAVVQEPLLKAHFSSPAIIGAAGGDAPGSTSIITTTTSGYMSSGDSSGKSSSNTTIRGNMAQTTARSTSTATCLLQPPAVSPSSAFSSNSSTTGSSSTGGCERVSKLKTTTYYEYQEPQTMPSSAMRHSTQQQQQQKSGNLADARIWRSEPQFTCTTTLYDLAYEDVGVLLNDAELNNLFSTSIEAIDRALCEQHVDVPATLHTNTNGNYNTQNNNNNIMFDGRSRTAALSVLSQQQQQSKPFFSGNAIKSNQLSSSGVASNTHFAHSTTSDDSSSGSGYGQTTIDVGITRPWQQQAAYSLKCNNNNNDYTDTTCVNKNNNSSNSVTAHPTANINISARVTRTSDTITLAHRLDGSNSETASSDNGKNNSSARTHKLLLIQPKPPSNAVDESTTAAATPQYNIHSTGTISQWGASDYTSNKAPASNIIKATAFSNLTDAAISTGGEPGRAYQQRSGPIQKNSDKEQQLSSNIDTMQSKYNTSATYHRLPPAQLHLEQISGHQQANASYIAPPSSHSFTNTVMPSTSKTPAATLVTPTAIATTTTTTKTSSASTAAAEEIGPRNVPSVQSMSPALSELSLHGSSSAVNSTPSPTPLAFGLTDPLALAYCEQSAESNSSASLLLSASNSSSRQQPGANTAQKLQQTAVQISMADNSISATTDGDAIQRIGSIKQHPWFLQQPPVHDVTNNDTNVIIAALTDPPNVSNKNDSAIMHAAHEPVSVGRQLSESYTVQSSSGVDTTAFAGQTWPATINSNYSSTIPRSVPTFGINSSKASGVRYSTKTDKPLLMFPTVATAPSGSTSYGCELLRSVREKSDNQQHVVLTTGSSSKLSTDGSNKPSASGAERSRQVNVNNTSIFEPNRLPRDQRSQSHGTAHRNTAGEATTVAVAKPPLQSTPIATLLQPMSTDKTEQHHKSEVKFDDLIHALSSSDKHEQHQLDTDKSTLSVKEKIRMFGDPNAVAASQSPLKITTPNVHICRLASFSAKNVNNESIKVSDSSSDNAKNVAAHTVGTAFRRRSCYERRGFNLRNDDDQKISHGVAAEESVPRTLLSQRRQSNSSSTSSGDSSNSSEKTHNSDSRIIAGSGNRLVNGNSVVDGTGSKARISHAAVFGNNSKLYGSGGASSDDLGVAVTSF